MLAGASAALPGGYLQRLLLLLLRSYFLMFLVTLDCVRLTVFENLKYFEIAKIIIEDSLWK